MFRLSGTWRHLHCCTKDQYSHAAPVGRRWQRRAGLDLGGIQFVAIFGKAGTLGYAVFLSRERRMRTIRLHIDQALTPGRDLPLPAQAGEHAVRVLRPVID
jgi:hypothetical protein